MTLRRVAALAQALALTVILLPGLEPGGPSLVQGAITLPEAEASLSFNTADRGVGCQAGSTRFRGPKLPNDPPWPPGAKPTPRPTPVPTVEALEDLAIPDPSTEPTADAPVALLASTGIRVAQAETDPEAADEQNSASDDQADAEITPDATPAPRKKGRKSRLLLGVDVSHHNGDIDFNKVRAAGNRFVIAKASQDTEFIDPLFLQNMARARAVGLAAGGYHFFDYTVDGTAQADHFLDRLEAGNAIDGALPPVVDVECWAPIGSSSQVVAAARLRDFVNRIYERTGRLPMVYTSVFMWNQVVGNAEGFEQLPLWAACWGCDEPPLLAPGWDEWAFWQTGISRVPGVGRLDGNYFNGTEADLEALKLRPFSIEAGAAVTGKQRVELDLGGRDATGLRTSPDGEQWSKWSPVRNKARAQLSPDEGEQMLYVQLRAGPGLRSPIISDSITLDRSGPEISKPSVKLREGAIGSGPASVPITVSWTAQDALAGLSDATVSISCGEGQNRRTEAPGSAEPGELVSWAGEASLVPAVRCALTAIARDGVGNTARTSLRGVRATVLPASGDASSATVQGEQVGIIATRGPDRGRAAVMVDGEAVGLFDLYAPVAGGPEVVFVVELSSGESRVVAVEGTGTSDPASGGSGISIEGFVTISVGADSA